MSPRQEQNQRECAEFIIHDIHDGACQYLIAAKMMFEAHRRGMTGTRTEQWRDFDVGLGFLSEGIDELRRLVHGLQPVQFVAGGLAEAVTCLIEEIRAAGGPCIELAHNIYGSQVPSRLSRSVFRIVQELLANACRHSKSHRVLVNLIHYDAILRIQVQDWGIGFDVNRIADGHFGLTSIRQRTESLGGTTKIRSKPSEGTCVTVEIPLTPRGNRN